MPERSSNSPADDSAEASRDAAPSSATPLEAQIRALELERDELARALDDARAAQLVSDAALRTRDELFAVIVHDLRNPLGTIVMGATALLQGEPSPDPKAQRIRTVAERIHRQAERMTRQLGNLSDFGEIQAGRLTIERATHQVADILAAASEQIAPIARERGIGFESQEPAALPALECDAERVVQTLANLATTAIKATARGGGVEIGARADQARLVFYVRDHVTTEPSSARPDASLSFTIARGIVEAHGGRIWTERDPAVGNTVCFSLSAAR